MGYCEDCGSKAYNGLCTNCHEENYIEKQYNELCMEVPETIYEKARENEVETEKYPIQDNLNKKSEW